MPVTPLSEAQKNRALRHWRTVASGLAGVMGFVALTACDHLGGQVSEVTESFQKTLDEKEKELASLRSSEASLRAQLTEAQGKIQTLQTEGGTAGGGTGGSGSNIDVAALARELAPLLNASHLAETRRPEMPAGGAAPAPAGGAVAEPVPGNFGLSEPVIRPTGPGGRDAGRGETSSRTRPSGGNRPAAPGGRGESFEPVGR